MDLKHQQKISRARELEAEGKILHAVQIYKTLIEEFPDIPESYIHLADIFQSNGQTKSAENIIRSIFNKQPDNYEIKLYFTQFLMQNENWGKAIELLKDLTTDDPFVLYLSGYCYFKRGEFEQARIRLLKFVKSDEEPELIHEAYFILAKIEFELKDYEDALKHAKLAELIFNDDWELHLVFAKIYYKFEMYTHGLDSIQKGLKINKKKPVLHYWAGKINVVLCNYAAAMEHINDYIHQKDNVTADDYIYFAEIFFSCSELHKALNYFDRAMELEPGNKQAIDGRNKTINLINNKAISDI